MNDDKRYDDEYWNEDDDEGIGPTRPITVFIWALVAAVIMIGILLAAWPAAAQEQPKCAPIAALRAKLLKDYGEVELSGGLVSDKMILTIFGKPDGSTWTAVFLGANGLACAFAIGQNWFQADLKQESF